MDRIKNGYIIGSLEVMNIAEKIRDNKLFKLFVRVKKRNNDEIIKKTGRVRVGVKLQEQPSL